MEKIAETLDVLVKVLDADTIPDGVNPTAMIQKLDPAGLKPIFSNASKLQVDGVLDAQGISEFDAMMNCRSQFTNHFKKCLDHVFPNKSTFRFDIHNSSVLAFCREVNALARPTSSELSMHGRHVFEDMSLDCHGQGNMNKFWVMIESFKSKVAHKFRGEFIEAETSKYKCIFNVIKKALHDEDLYQPWSETCPEEIPEVFAKAMCGMFKNYQEFAYSLPTGDMRAIQIDSKNVSCLALSCADCIYKLGKAGQVCQDLVLSTEAVVDIPVADIVTNIDKWIRQSQECLSEIKSVIQAIKRNKK